MEKKKIPKRMIVAVGLVILAVTIIALFVSINISPVRNLYPAEIRNYQGEDLSSVADVRPYTVGGIQNINQSSYNLTITGLVDRTLNLSYDDVLNGYQRYQKVVNLHCVVGWQATILWEGVLVEDLLKDAGANMSAPVVIFRASDGYSTSLPLDYIVKNNILLAYKMNNITIPTERGFPFQLVAESQFGYKWIKWLTQIEVSDNSNFLGYWESRGYANNATIPGR